MSKSIYIAEVKSRIQKGNIDKIYFNNTWTCPSSAETVMGRRESREQDNNNIAPTNVSGPGKVISSYKAPRMSDNM